jgi:hypothetical protein
LRTNNPAPDLLTDSKRRGGGALSLCTTADVACVSMVRRRLLVSMLLVVGALVPRAAGAVKPSPLPPGPALFEAGAAVASITPPPHGSFAGDPADCQAPASFDGLRRFAFEEPYRDDGQLRHFASGDPYVDCNGNGRWDGVLLGGGADAPRFATVVADDLSARALVVSNHRQVVAVEVLDQEGLFNVYQERIRARVAADGYRLDNIFISATHDESAPDTLGISGLDQLTSGVDAYYVDFLVTRSARAIEDAYDRMRPARLKYAEGIEPANLRQCWSSYPFVDDQLMPTMQAVATNGSVIATLGDVSQHAETLGFNPDPQQRTWISADWPHFFRSNLEQRYGGVAIEMAGSVGSNETPEVFTNPISRTPQHFVSASHPAGCRTLFDPNGTQVPVGYAQETTVLGQQLGNAVGSALDQKATWSTSSVISGARADICIPLTNIFFALGAQLGVFAERPGYSNNCTIRHPVAANGTTSGDELLSQVATFRIGDGEFISVPGEVFPFTYLRSFLSPQDMPKPEFPLPPWPLPHMHAPHRFVDGLAEDMLGYIFPRGNGVGVVGEPGSNDTDRFGCGHSDDSEATTSQAGDIVGTALVGLLDHANGPPEDVRVGRYVLPGGTRSRNPLGIPESIKCDIDTTFTPLGPALGIWLAGTPSQQVIVPSAWMSLSGTRQSMPDRNTRGWIDRDGTRHWLDVFPDTP